MIILGSGFECVDCIGYEGVIEVVVHRFYYQKSANIALCRNCKIIHFTIIFASIAW